MMREWCNENTTNMNLANHLLKWDPWWKGRQIKYYWNLKISKKFFHIIFSIRFIVYDFDAHCIYLTIWLRKYILIIFQQSTKNVPWRATTQLIYFRQNELCTSLSYSCCFFSLSVRASLMRSKKCTRSYVMNEGVISVLNVIL